MSTHRKSKRGTGTTQAPAPEAPKAHDLLSMEEAISLLKTTRPTFYRWLRSGRLKGMKVGRQWRFYREDIDRFLKGQQPRIDLPADIDPLIDDLKARLKALGVHSPGREDVDKTSQAVGLMIQLASAMNASDLHIDPAESGAQLRLRVDGALHVICRLDGRLLPAVAERWKTMAGMDPAEKSVPQDGRILATVGGKRIDLRVNVMPAYFGEAVVARLLLPDAVCLDMDRLDYAPPDRQRLERWANAPWGVIILTGPAGCGKTTSLYGCLMKAANERTKVLSVEEPVEYALPGVTQMQLDPKAGLTLERAMRSVMRADPDVIMVNEIRTGEACQLCLQAAVTGHLVLTTLHVDEAAGALRRMLDLGCEPFLVADATKLVVAQRLVRRLCPECSVEAVPSTEHLSRAEHLARTGGLAWERLERKYRRAVGCAKCGQLGFRGRRLVAEALEMTPEIAAALRRGAAAEELRAIAVRQGMTTMAADGVRRAAQGQVLLEEVLGITGSINY